MLAAGVRFGVFPSFRYMLPMVDMPRGLLLTLRAQCQQRAKGLETNGKVALALALSVGLAQYLG